MNYKVLENEIFGLIKPEVDVHSLGLSSVGKLLEDCGYTVIYANPIIEQALTQLSKINNISSLNKWIIQNKITCLGYSYRLDPKDAQYNFGKVFHLLKEYQMLSEQGGAINQIFFAGLPEACELIKNEYKNKVQVFQGDETQLETLKKIGVPESKISSNILSSSKYDDSRLSFAKELINTGKFQFEKCLPKLNYSNYGTFKDDIITRINFNRLRGDLPLMRAHVGPYQYNYQEAKKEFQVWLKILSQSGYLDIVSIGSSQLSQSHFGQDWSDKPNGGGVPINSEQDLHDIWEASRPMLVRTYAGTSNIPYLADVYERTINIAWHALSFWWFNQIDGRGPNSVLFNLEQHYETLKLIAKSGKPFEPNIPHHFSFRGADDYTYVLSAYLAAKTAKLLGVKYLIVQTMLNTPKYTFGVQDLAKARALMKLVRELEDKQFTVYLQPRAGLDYFSPDFNKARIQLAAVTAMMDDIEPENFKSPDIIHVVSYCEGVKLANPNYINESIQITINSLKEYRHQKEIGLLDNMRNHHDVNERTSDIYNEVKSIVKLIERHINQPYSPIGLYTIFKKGIMPVPYLWNGKVEFHDAVKWNTKMFDGAVKVVDLDGKPMNPTRRVMKILMDI